MHVLITGGSSGIGAAISAVYAARGANVSLVARGAAALESRRDALVSRHPGQRFRCETADVRVTESLAMAIRNCELDLGPIDVLVTSAGVVEPGRFEFQPPERFAEQIDTNLMGTVNAVRAVYPGMIARGSGRIVMIASGAGLIGIHGYSAYCASKFGLVGFAEALRQEARSTGVGISICFPPDTDTPQLDAELKLRSAEASAIIGLAPRWSAERVARVTVERATSGRFAIYPSAQLALLARLGPLVAPLRHFIDSRIRKADGR